MKDQNKTKAQLAKELAALRRRIAKMEAREARRQREKEDSEWIHDFAASISQSMAEGVVMEDTEGQLVFVNRAAATLLGYTPQELTGQHWTLVIPPDQHSIVEAADARRARGLTDRYEVELVGKNGNRLTVLVAGSPRLDEAAHFIGTLAVFTDITERKQTEASLHASERFSRAVIENLPMGLSVRSQTGRLLYYNEAWKKIWAMSDQAVQADLARERSELVFDQSDDYLKPHLDELRQVYTCGGSLHLPELHLTRPRPGAAQWIAQHFYAIKDEHGQVDRVVILTEDITARKHIEEALRKSEEQFRALFENSPDGLVLMDPVSRTIIDCNEAICHMNGYSRDELIGQSIDIFSAAPGTKESQAAYTTSLRKGRLEYETYHRRKDGSIFPIEVSTSIITLSGREVILGIDRDITERKRVEQTLAQRARELTALYETALEINAQPDLATLLSAIVERATGLLGARMGGLYLLRPDGETLELVVAHNLPGNYAGTQLRLGEGLSGRIAQTGELMMVEDYSCWEGRAAVYGHDPFRRVLGVPLKVRGTVIGVINVTDDERTGLFSQDEIRLVSLFADQAALVVEKARLFAEAQKRIERMQVLNEIGQALASTLGLKQLYQVIHQQVCRVLKVDAFYVALHDERKGSIHFPFLYDEGIQLEPSTEPLGEGPASHVIRTKASLLANRPGDPIQAHGRSFGNLERPSASALHVPMLAGDRVIGVISTQSYQENAYSPEDQQVLEVIASQAAIALENARLYQAEREQREIAETLKETGTLLAATLDAGAVLDCVLQQISRVMPNDAVDIMFIEGDRVGVARWRGYDRFDAGEFIATFTARVVDLYGLPQMIATSEPLVIPDTQADPRWINFAPTKWMRSYAGAPLRVRGRVIGFLNVCSATPGQFGQADADRLSAFANQAALALANARLFQAEQEQRELSETLREIGATLAATLDADVVLDRLLEQIGRVVPNEMATIMLVESGMVRVAKQKSSPVRVHGQVSELAFPLVELHGLREAAETGNPLIMSDIRFYPSWLKCLGVEWIRAYVIAPIRLKRQVIGLLGLASSTIGFFAPLHAVRLQVLADQVAIALENARLVQAEREQFSRWQESQAQLIQAEKMAALGRLVGSISHEFNNPLQAVMGALELCREELQHRAQPEQLKRLVTIMEKETERIAAIVRRVRDFYRPVRQEKRLIDIRAVVNDVLELAGEQLLRYNIAVKRDMAGNEADQLPLINVNRDDLKQVLLNLVLNAIDAMETSGGTLRVRTAPDKIQPPGAEPRPAVRIEIGDTGTGIPPEFLPHIFEPFVTTRPDQATPIVPKAALGLSISYGIIQAYGGKISVSSQMGIGTTFTILLSAEQS